MFGVLIPTGVVTAYGIIQLWSRMRCMYFASYLATLAFWIDDPTHRIYRESKIMRNAI